MNLFRFSQNYQLQKCALQVLSIHRNLLVVHLLVATSREPSVLRCESDFAQFSSDELWRFQFERDLCGLNRMFHQQRRVVLLDFRGQRSRAFIGKTLLRVPSEKCCFVGGFSDRRDEGTILDGVFSWENFESCQDLRAGREKSLEQHCENCVKTEIEMKLKL
jgi:hypothetical protein